MTLNLPLTLLPAKSAMPEVSAGWLASGDPVEWLAETARCRRQGCEVALYPVAASVADSRAVGVLIVLRRGMPQFRARVVPLGELMPGVHAPLDAVMSAGLLPNERDFLFPYSVHFFHPSLGLIGFEAKDELSPAKLLEMPRRRESSWNLALPVTRFSPTLLSIHVVEPEDPGTMLEEAAKRIGDQSGQPIHGKGGIVDKAAMLGMGLAGGTLLGAAWLIGGLAKAFKSNAVDGPGNIPLERLREWAQKNWKHLAENRNREIDRLMKLMEENPDEGLRYALPLTGSGQSRGRAAPSWTLGRRSTLFSQGHGGGAIDEWDLGNNARLKLERQYREAAKREIALGNHDRAAYIYGNLLADWNSAAKVLAEAGRHRDAVSIYIHKLNNRNAAAKCLEDAGLLLQAAVMFAECRQFEKAGDLHARLGNDAQAGELWQAAAAALSDPMEKARVFSEKLEDHAAALEVLDACWKSGNRPDTALVAMFAILRKDDAVREGVELLGKMFEHVLPSFSLSARLYLGHAEAAKWEDPALSLELEKEAYHRIGKVLSEGGGDSSGVLAFLPKLDPDDLLLARDAKRFSLKRNPPKIPTTGSPRGSLKPIQIVPISSQIRWDSVAEMPKGVSIAGYGQDMLGVAQFRGNSCHSSALRTPDDPGKCEVRHLALTSIRGCSRVFHFNAHRRLHFRSLDRVRGPNDDAIGDLRDVLAIGPYGNEGDFAILQYNPTSSLSVSIYSEAAVLRRTFPIDLAPRGVASLDWRIAGGRELLCFAAAGFFAWRDAGGRFSTMSLGEDAPKSLHLSPVAKEALISVSWQVLLIGPPKPGKAPETVNLYSDPTADSPPVSCYLPDGSVVIAYRGGGVIYTAANRLEESATLSFPTDSGDPIDICPRGASGFAILTDTGKLVVF